MDVTIGGRQYELSETLHSDELAPIFEDAWTASRVWHASCFLSEQLVSFASKSAESSHEFLDLRGGRSVIELGSGCGLVGLVAAALGGHVLLTDQKQAIELLQRNIDQNMHTAAEKQRVQVAEYQWGAPPAEAHLPLATYDYIVISDCINPIYGVDSWRNLARSIEMLSSATTVTYLAHEARGDDEAMADFQAFSAQFLSVETIVHDPSKRLTWRNVMTKMTSTCAGVGIFWGESGGSQAVLPATRERKPTYSRHCVSLPDLRTAAETQLVLPRELTTAADPSCSHASTVSLLTVLQTLWRSIAKDTSVFEDKIAQGKRPAAAGSSSYYYNRGVFDEDSSYFLHERETEYHKEMVHRQTQLMRELHCATENQQHYAFDRTAQPRRQHGGSRKTTTTTTSRGKGASMQRDETTKTKRDDQLISRHDHKIQHLLHVLQAEIANETKREIRSLAYWSSSRSPQKRVLSRQSKRNVATIVKERYEAADWIMRILEEYHIVIGVEAAAYLESTIKEGNALANG